MKKSAIILSTVLFSLSAFADVSAANQDFVGKAFNLLVNRARLVRLDGDVRTASTMRPAMNELVSHIRSFKTGAQDKTGITAFDMSCEKYRLAARCTLVVQKALGMTGYTFMVGYDQNGQPSSILENRATVARGD